MIDIKKADCMDLMSTMGGGEIDLIVTDPPYLFDSLSGEGIARVCTHFNELDKLKQGIDSEELDEFMRILKKPNMYLWGNWKLILRYLAYFEDKNVSTNLLCWHKSNPLPLCNNQYLKDTEYCLFVRSHGVKLYGKYKDHFSYWVTSNNDTRLSKTGHPTVKPLPIIQQMVENSSLPGDTVFDPFLGSGTTAVACKLTNRNFIGCEIDEKYIPIIHKRLEDVEPRPTGGLDDWI